MALSDYSTTTTASALRANTTNFIGLAQPPTPVTVEGNPLTAQFERQLEQSQQHMRTRQREQECQAIMPRAYVQTNQPQPGLLSGTGAGAGVGQAIAYQDYQVPNTAAPTTAWPTQPPLGTLLRTASASCDASNNRHAWECRHTTTCLCGEAIRNAPPEGL